MQMRGEGAVAGEGRYILGETPCRFLQTLYALALEEVVRYGHNQMDPRCSLEPAYEEDAATD